MNVNLMGRALDHTEDCLGDPDPQEDRDREAVEPVVTAGARVLVIDGDLPRWDEDAGSFRMFALLKILRGLGHEVTLGADIGRRSEPHETDLATQGIKVLSGRASILDDLESRGGDYQWVILSRPSIAHTYLFPVRYFAINSWVFYDTVDLHWLRTTRMAEITSNPVALQDAKWLRKVELIATSCCDATFTVSEREREILRGEVPEARVEVLPTIYDIQSSSRPFGSRSGLLFIGNFLHLPNGDGIVWFIDEILPLLRRQIPGVSLRVLGSALPESLERRQSPDTEMIGYRREVDSYFHESRVFVAPLRYGAGIKGKVVQSMGLGLPVATTSIGAEGLNLVSGQNALIADSPAEFAAAVARVYSDEVLWSRLVEGGRQTVLRHFSRRVVGSQLTRILAANTPSPSPPGRGI